jgi:hypothetical protein
MKRGFKLCVALMLFALLPFASADEYTNVLIGTDINLPNHNWDCNATITDENGSVKSVEDINYLSADSNTFFIPVIYGKDYTTTGLYFVDCVCYNSEYLVNSFCDEIIGFRVVTTLVGDKKNFFFLQSENVLPIFFFIILILIALFFFLRRRDNNV